MKRAFLLLLLILCRTDYAFSQKFYWVKQAGSTLNEAGTAIAVDAEGSSYVTGTFGGIANFSNALVTSFGGNDIFVASYSPNGALQSVQKAGGSQFDYGRGIGVDSVGYACVTGGYQSGSANFPPSLGLNNSNPLTSNFFLARIK